jgi:hypothetical protein
MRLTQQWDYSPQRGPSASNPVELRVQSRWLTPEQRQAFSGSPQYRRVGGGAHGTELGLRATSLISPMHRDGHFGALEVREAEETATNVLE